MFLDRLEHFRNFCFFPHKKIMGNRIFSTWVKNMQIFYMGFKTYKNIKIKRIIAISFIFSEMCQKNYEILGEFSSFPHKKNNWPQNKLQKCYFAIIYFLLPFFHIGDVLRNQKKI